MKKKHIFFFITSSCATLVLANDKEPKVLLKKENNGYIPCNQYIGKSLIACMDAQDNKGFKDNFLNLDGAPLQRKCYLEETLKTKEDYENLFNKFSKNEWQEVYATMSPEERALFPENEENLSNFVRAKRSQKRWKEVKTFYNEHPFLASVTTTSIGLLTIVAVIKTIF